MLTPKYFQAESTRHDRWLISYVDIVTILLILFVAVAAHGVPREQAAAPKRAVEPVNAPVSQALLAAKEKLERRGIAVEVRERSLIVSLPQAVLYASGEDRISADAVPTISHIVEVLRDTPYKVTLIGHADATPVHGRFRNNWELSTARSLRLLEMLTAQFGIPEERLSISSQGSNSPKSTNQTEDGRAANRRVEIVIQG